MAAIKTYTKTGNKATTTAKLNKNVFGIDVKNHELLKSAYVAYLANGRTNLAQSKSRGMVSGGGKKPWRQKGTGRARFGSSRNPIWRGGGVAFGPTGDENYTHKLNITAKRQAIRQALSLAATEDKISVIEKFDFNDGKAAPAAKLFTKLGTTGTTLVVVEEKNELVDRATRNLPKIKAVQAKYLNVYDVMNASNIVISEGALKIIDEWLGVTTTKEKTAATVGSTK